MSLYYGGVGAIQKLINNWSECSLSVLGKITVVKSLSLSKLYYFGQLLPNPSEVFMSHLNDTIFKFVWNGKPDKIKLFQIILDYKFGGAKLPTFKHSLML